MAADNGLWRYSGDAPPQAVAAPAAVDPANFRALAVTAEGLWLGTNNNGAWLRNDAGWQQYRRRPERAPLHLPHVGRALGNPVHRDQRQRRVPQAPRARADLEHWGTENGLPSNVVSVVLEDRENNVWVGTDIGGLARLSGMAVINHTEKQGLPSACVFGITPGDTPDSLWLGTMRGAVHYQVRPRPRVLETVRAGDGLGNEWVWKVLRTADGTLWFMTDTALLFRQPGRENHPRPARRRSLPAHGPL